MNKPNHYTDQSSYYIECVTNDGLTYFQAVRRKDEYIYFANQSLSVVADKLYKPCYKDGSPVIL